MIKHIYSLITFTFFAVFFGANLAYGETPFIADELIYNANTDEIIAQGDVEIDSDQGYFYLDQLIYDIETGAITITGNVRGVLPTGEKIRSDFAFIDPDNQQLILRNAHLLLQSQLQIVASRIKESENITYGENVTLTSCEVCVINPVPIWQIKAEQVYRDKNLHKIYLRDAEFEFFGIPIFYLPKMRIPDNEATRMSGFLQPEIIFSDLFEVGVRTPYFHVIDENSDILVTPYLTSSNVINFEGRYRHTVRGGMIQLDGAYSLNDGEDEYGRYFLQSKVSGQLTKSLSLDAIYTLNSENDFAPNFSYDNAETNYLTLGKTGDNHDFSIGVTDYRATSIANETSNNPLLLPNVNFKSNQHIGLGTVVFTDFSILGLNNDNVDNAAVDVSRLSALIGVDDVYGLPFGVSLKSHLGGQAQLYRIGDFDEDDFEYGTRVTPTISVDATLPLAKVDAYGSSLIIPRAQFVWSENYLSGADIPNSDAIFIEHDYITLFSSNQYSGQDRLENGLRINLGASYVHNSNAGDDIDLGFGRVIRLTPDDNLLEFEGSESKDSEWVGYANYSSSKDYSIYTRGAWDKEYKLSRLEVGFDMTKSNYAIQIEGIQLQPEPEIGYDDVRREATLNGFYHFAPNWQADFSWQYDLITTSALEGSIGLTYGNECFEARAGYVRDYNRGEGIDPETRYEIGVSFIGLGQEPTRDWPRRECSSMSQLN